MKKHDNIVKYLTIGVLSLATFILLVVNACTTLSGFWKVNIGDGIEIFILIFVSFYLVKRKNSVDRKKGKINDRKIDFRIRKSAAVFFRKTNSAVGKLYSANTRI